MALSLQQQYPASELDITGYATTQFDGNRNIIIQPGNSIIIELRFGLPRSATTGKGSKLVSCALAYNFVSAATGDLSAATPTITRIAQVNGIAESQTALTITGTAPAFQLTSADTNINRPVSSVTENFDNQATGQSISYLYKVIMTAGAAAVDLEIGGVEVVYQFIGGDNAVAGTLITNAGATFDEDFSGFQFPVDSSGGAVTITLPNIAAGSTPIASYVVRTGGNAINISPDASDYITGLNLNPTPDVNKDYILASPNPGDFIILAANGNATGGWYVVSAGGTWTRQA